MKHDVAPPSKGTFIGKKLHKFIPDPSLTKTRSFLLNTVWFAVSTLIWMSLFSIIHDVVMLLHIGSCIPRNSVQCSQVHKLLSNRRIIQ